MVKEGVRAALTRVSQMSRMHSFEQTRNRFTLSADIHTTVQRGNVSHGILSAIDMYKFRGYIYQLVLSSGLVILSII